VKAGLDVGGLIEVRFHVLPSEKLSPEIRARVDRTIDRLKLNDRECRTARERYAADYWNGAIPYAYLGRRAPFIALELQRLGRLREGDA
jgi:hypothetical protein